MFEYYTNLHSPRLPDAKRLPIKRLAREAAGLFVTRAAIESRSFNLLYNVLMGQFLTVFSGCNWHLFCLLSHLLITPCAKHSTSAVWWRNGRSKQKRINLRGRNKLEKRRGRRRRGGRKVATKECKCYTACIYIYTPALALREVMQQRRNRKWGKTTTCLRSIVHTQFIRLPVPISFQRVSSLLHSPALMRHNADNMSLPLDHVSTTWGVYVQETCIKGLTPFERPCVFYYFYCGCFLCIVRSRGWKEVCGQEENVLAAFSSVPRNPLTS